MEKMLLRLIATVESEQLPSRLHGNFMGPISVSRALSALKSFENRR